MKRVKFIDLIIEIDITFEKKVYCCKYSVVCLSEQ